MKANPPETRQAPSLQALALVADQAWGDELRRLFGARAGDVRYTAAGAGAPGSALRALHDAKLAADAAMWGNAPGAS